MSPPAKYPDVLPTALRAALKARGPAFAWELVADVRERGVRVRHARGLATQLALMPDVTRTLTRVRRVFATRATPMTYQAWRYALRSRP